MTKKELMGYVGKKVHIFFKDGGKDIYGTLGYVDEFSAKYDYRKPTYFYIGNTSFKVSHIRKLEENDMKGLFIPEITAEMFKNGCLESIEALMAEGEIYDIEYSPWIPVTERLPKYNTPVLLALKQIGNERTIVIGERRTRKSGWYYVDIAAYDPEHEVLAWMPLPEPYKAESEE